MKFHSRAQVALLLALLFTLQTCHTGAQAARLLSTKVHPSSQSTMAASSQTHKDLQVDKKDPFKQVQASIRGLKEVANAREQYRQSNSFVNFGYTLLPEWSVYIC
ncbi:unnamed protein product [Ilex paraguariensis]|uniref:Uncharacterized protein n=1 Tax=Ilex paraguariensis TaxID=185542 RepID=A0ABC8RPU1_9AQUA